MDEHQKAMKRIYEAEDPEPGGRSLDELIAVIQGVLDDPGFDHIKVWKDDLNEVVDLLRAGDIVAGCKALRRTAGSGRGALQISDPKIYRALQDVLADLKDMIGYGNYESREDENREGGNREDWIKVRVDEILRTKDPDYRQRREAEEHQARMRSIYGA